MSSPQQESFQSMATVFILQDKTWIERGSGLVRFVFDLRTFALRLVIRPGTADEFECKLRPRIRSKGPRAYVVRAQAENGSDEHILAVRFEREEDSRSFRRFVEKRDVDHNQKNVQSNITQNVATNYQNAHVRGPTDYTNNTAAVQQQNPPYHRHQNRTSSNVAQQNGYGGYGGNNAIRGYNNSGGGAGGGGFYGNPNSNTTSKQGNYFWTCSRCLQMVDPSLSSCHVCGTMRDPSQYNAQQTGSQVLQQINPNHYPPHSHHHQSGIPSNGINNMSRHHQASNTHATYGSSAHHQIAASSMTPSNHINLHHQSMQSTSIDYTNPNTSNGNISNMQQQYQQQPVQPQAVILKLTTVNLEKHNKQYPPKRRNVKEIIQTQLEYLRTHQ